MIVLNFPYSAVANLKAIRATNFGIKILHLWEATRQHNTYFGLSGAQGGLEASPKLEKQGSCPSRALAWNESFKLN